jgi:hypothetical protein
MDLERSLLEMIDEYISDAMAATGTKRAPRTPQLEPPAIEEVTPLPRTRAARGTVDLDDEITNIVVVVRPDSTKPR